MTFNGVMAVILRYSIEFGSFGTKLANYVKVVKYTVCNNNAAQKIYDDIRRGFWKRIH